MKMANIYNYISKIKNWAILPSGNLRVKHYQWRQIFQKKPDQELIKKIINQCQKVADIWLYKRLHHT